MDQALLIKLHAAAFQNDGRFRMADFWKASAAGNRRWSHDEREEFLARPDACWSLAVRFAMLDEPSGLLRGDACRWIDLAAAWIRSKGRLRRNPRVEAMLTARGHHEDRTDIRLRAALLARDASVETVAEGLEMEAPVVEAYENLFFRVLHLKEDAAARERVMLNSLAERGCKYVAEKENPRDGRLMRAALRWNLEEILGLIRAGAGDGGDEGSMADPAEALIRLAADWLDNADPGSVPPELVRSGLALAARRASGKPAGGKPAYGLQGNFGELAMQEIDRLSECLQRETAKKALATSSPPHAGTGSPEFAEIGNPDRRAVGVQTDIYIAPLKIGGHGTK